MLKLLRRMMNMGQSLCLAGTIAVLPYLSGYKIKRFQSLQREICPENQFRWKQRTR